MLNGDWYLSDAEPQEISEGYIRPVRRVRGPDLAQNPAGHGSDVACEIRAPPRSGDRRRAQRPYQGTVLSGGQVSPRRAYRASGAHRPVSDYPATARTVGRPSSRSPPGT